MAAFDLTALATVRTLLQDGSNQLPDALLSLLITAASRVILDETRREFAPPTVAAEDRPFLYRGGGYLDLSPYDLRGAPVSVTLDTHLDAADQVALTADEYVLHPEPARHGVYQWLEILGYDVRHGRRPRRVTINGQWGFAEVPEDVAHWCALTVVLWVRDNVSAFSTTFDLEEGRREVPEHLPAAVRFGLRHWARRSVG